MSAENNGGQVLTWHKIKGGQYELRQGEQVLASLNWQRAGGTLAEAKTAENQWTFKRTGFWHPRVTVREAGQETEIAVFEPSWSGKGTLTVLQGNRQFYWSSSNFWQSKWGWQNGDKQTIVNFHAHTGFNKVEAEVTITPGVESLPETPFLTVLGFYLLILAMNDTAAATVSTTTVIAATSATM